ncbi:MAG: M15 family metallopeptidase [bacterium]
MLAFCTGLFIPKFIHNSPDTNLTKNQSQIINTLTETGTTINSEQFQINYALSDLQSCEKIDLTQNYFSDTTNPLLTLVDKNFEVTEDFVPGEMILLTQNDAPVVYSIYINKEIEPALLELIAAMKNDNVPGAIKSGWRSFSQQQRVYDIWSDRVGASNAGDYAALPGHSEHYLGTAIDFSNSTGQYLDNQTNQWLQTNAYRFGFVQSYPLGKETITGYNYEPWHYRYVGKEIAISIKDQEITLGEYLYGIHNICRGKS